MQLRLMRDEVARGSGPPTRPGRRRAARPDGARVCSHPGAPGRLAADGAGRDPGRARPGARRARTRRVRGPRADAGHASDRRPGGRPAAAMSPRSTSPPRWRGGGWPGPSPSLPPRATIGRSCWRAARGTCTPWAWRRSPASSPTGAAVSALGARTPERTLVTAAIATDAAAVVVVSHLATQRRPAVEALRAVAANRALVFYAGNALFPGARSNCPARISGTAWPPRPTDHGGPHGPLGRTRSRRSRRRRSSACQGPQPVIARMPATYGATASVSPARDST